MGSEAAALIGMGLCAAGFFGAALGIAYIFAKTIETVGRQPNAEAKVAKYCWIGLVLRLLRQLLSMRWLLLSLLCLSDERHVKGLAT